MTKKKVAPEEFYYYVSDYELPCSFASALEAEEALMEQFNENNIDQQCGYAIVKVVKRFDVDTKPTLLENIELY